MSTVKLLCSWCQEFFERERRHYSTNIARENKSLFCSPECRSAFRHKFEQRSTALSCTLCDSEIKRTPGQLAKSKSGRAFCGASCAATYNNTHKDHGTRVSRLELWLAEELRSLYPTIEFHFNQKDAINSELDIFVPTLKLAFELNGIFHYEPIYGPHKLSQIQSNDTRKFQACLERGIELCIIDTTQMKRFTPKGAQKYLDIVKEILAIKLADI
jgi:hypothetical protein